MSVRTRLFEMYAAEQQKKKEGPAIRGAIDEARAVCKKSIEEKVLDPTWEAGGFSPERLVNLIKRSWDDQRPKDIAEAGVEEFIDHVKAFCRGRLGGERANLATLTLEASVVHCSPGVDLATLHVVDFNFPSLELEEGGYPTKGRILTTAVESRVAHRTRKEFDKLDWDLDALRKSEVFAGIVARDTRAIYRDSVLPDAFLLSRFKGSMPVEAVQGGVEEHESMEQAGLVGVVEAKAYTPEEISKWVLQLKEQAAAGTLTDDLTVRFTGKEIGMKDPDKEINLGVSVGKEVAFLDELRLGRLGEDVGKLGKEAVVLLRFPADAQDEDLTALGELLENKLGYKKVVIQKMLQTSKELLEYGVRVLAKQWDKVKKGTIQFSRDQQEAIEKNLFAAYGIETA